MLISGEFVDLFPLTGGLFFHRLTIAAWHYGASVSQVPLSVGIARGFVLLASGVTRL